MSNDLIDRARNRLVPDDLDYDIYNIKCWIIWKCDGNPIILQPQVGILQLVV